MKFLTKNISFASIIVCITLSTQASAKGLNQLTPDAKGSTEQAKEEVKEKAQSAVKDGEEKVTEAISATNEAPTSKLSKNLLIGTSFGWAGASKGSDNWRAAGMSDITVSYKLPNKIMNQQIYGTFRYAPMDVTPVIAEDNTKFEYLGTIEAYHFGAATGFKVKKFVVNASAELGYLNITLKDQLGVGATPPEDAGFTLTLGSGADWELLDGFQVGPKVYLGLGNFITTQFTGSATFAF